MLVNIMGSDTVPLAVTFPETSRSEPEPVSGKNFMTTPGSIKKVRPVGTISLPETIYGEFVFVRVLSWARAPVIK